MKRLTWWNFTFKLNSHIQIWILNLNINDIVFCQHHSSVQIAPTKKEKYMRLASKEKLNIFWVLVLFLLLSVLLKLILLYPCTKEFFFFCFLFGLITCNFYIISYFCCCYGATNIVKTFGYLEKENITLTKHAKLLSKTLEFEFWV